jgi:hypothetical protein
MEKTLIIAKEHVRLSMTDQADNATRGTDLATRTDGAVMNGARKLDCI